jgi:DsbC/DsbD-like thiol-disulfide interchange protein
MRLCASVAVFAFGAWAAAQGQAASPSAQNRSIAKVDSVEYLFPEQVSVTAGKPISLALHFRIAQGLHINSHTPGDEYLIPTVFSIPDGAGARLAAAAYPPGTVFTLPADPTVKLDVYTGEFVIHARIVAEAGNRLVQGKLRYQACDNNACMPPRTITVPIDVMAK